MRVQLQQSDVLSELAFLKAAFKEDTDPLTLETGSDAVTMTAGSSLCHLTTCVPAGVVKPGGGRLLAGLFQSIVNGLGSTQFTLDTESDRAEISAGLFEAKLNRPFETKAVDPRTKQQYDRSFDINSAILLQLITLAAPAFPESTQSLGVLFEATADYTRIVATDGHRLNIASGPGGIADARLILSGELLSQIVKTLDGYDGNVVVNFVDKKAGPISVLAGRRLLRAAMSGKDFPDCDRIVPKEFKARVTVSREQFLRVIHRTTILANKEAPSVVLTYTGTELQCECKNVIEDKRGRKHEENGRDVVPIVTESGEPFRIRVNSKFITQSLSLLAAAQVEILCVSERVPLMIVPVTEDQNVRVMIMPMSMDKW